MAAFRQFGLSLLGYSAERIREIAKTGGAGAIDKVNAALGHKNPALARAALLGLQEAFENEDGAGWIVKQSESVFESASALVRHGFLLERISGRCTSTEEVRRLAIRILPKLSPTLAAEVLQEPSVLRTSNPDFHVILKVLSDHGIALEQSIDPYVTEIRSKALADEFPYPYFYGQLLRAAATQKHPLARELVQDALASFRTWPVSENAAEAMWILLDLSPRLENDILALAQRTGVENLPFPLQQYCAVFDYYHDAMNGGLSQFFYNPGSDHVHLVLEALHAMEANIDFYNVNTAMGLFGASGPPVDRVERWNVMEANDRTMFAQIDSIRAPEGVSQKFDAIVHAKLYLAKHVEICKLVPRTHI